jgi:hypothetical protein
MTGCASPTVCSERTSGRALSTTFQKIDRDLCWSSEMRFRVTEDGRANYPATIMYDVLGALTHLTDALADYDKAVQLHTALVEQAGHLE